MTEAERRLYQFLLLVDAAAIIVSMVAGPLRHTAAAVGAGASAALISVIWAPSAICGPGGEASL